MFALYNTSPNQKFSRNKLLVIGICFVCIAAAAIAAVLSFLPGKNPPSKFSLDLSAIKNSQGDFSFHGLEYGDSLAQVEAALGIEISGSFAGTEPENFTPVDPQSQPAETGVFFPEDTVSYMSDASSVPDLPSSYP